MKDTVKILQPAVFLRADCGCYADGAFGHDHAREVLSDLLDRIDYHEAWSPQCPNGCGWWRFGRLDSGAYACDMCGWQGRVEVVHLLTDWQDTACGADPAEEPTTRDAGESTCLRCALAGPMSDDAQEENDALELLNNATEEGCYWEFDDGNLVLMVYEEVESR